VECYDITNKSLGRAGEVVKLHFEGVLPFMLFMEKAIEIAALNWTSFA